MKLWRPLFRKSEAPTSASTPQQLEALLRASVLATANGITVNHELALRVPEVLACINVLAQSMSMLPLHMYRTTATGREKISDHPVYKTLGRKPNPLQSPLEFRRVMTFRAAWRGNAYAYVTRLGGRVLQVVPISAPVTPRVLDNYTMEYEVQLPKGDRRVLKQSEVFHLRGPVCLDGAVACSPVELGRDAIATMVAIERFAGRYFSKGAQAKGAFRLPAGGALKDSEFDRLKSELNAAASGDVIPLLEQGLEWVAMDYSARDSLLDSMQAAQILKICRIWRIQPHMVQEMKAATFSNIEHQSREFVDHTLMPWIRLWESAIQMQLIEDDSDDAPYPKISAQALLRGDNKTRSEMYRSAVGGPYMTPNEARGLEEMDVIEGGNELLRPMNMGEADEDEEQADDATVVDDVTGEVDT